MIQSRKNTVPPPKTLFLRVGPQNCVPASLWKVYSSSHELLNILLSSWICASPALIDSSTQAEFTGKRGRSESLLIGAIGSVILSISLTFGNPIGDYKVQPSFFRLIWLQLYDQSKLSDIFANIHAIEIKLEFLKYASKVKYIFLLPAIMRTWTFRTSIGTLGLIGKIPGRPLLGPHGPPMDFSWPCRKSLQTSINDPFEMTSLLDLVDTDRCDGLFPTSLNDLFWPLSKISLDDLSIRLSMEPLRWTLADDFGNDLAI